MSYTIDLSTHGKELKVLYDSIISSDPEVTWAVFNYGAGSSNALKPVAHGPGHGNYLEDFIEEFDDGLVQYGFVRIDYNNLPKFVLVGWVGEGVPERTKGYFNAHYATVAKYFHGYHVQITARSSNDLSPSIILDKVDTGSGSKYSSGGSRTVQLRPKYSSNTTGAAEEDWGDAPQSVNKDDDGPTLTKVESSYKPTKVDIASLKKGPVPAPRDRDSDSGTSAKKAIFEEAKSSYQPIGKVNIAALRAEAKANKFADDRPAPLQSSYQPIGKVDIAAIRAQANNNKKFDDKPEPLQSSYQPIGKVDIGAIKSQASGNSNKFDKPKVESTANRGAKIDLAAGSNDDDEEENFSAKSVKERMSAFSGSGRLTELPKPKVDRSVVNRFQPSGARGTAPSLPVDSFGRASPKAAPGFKDFASEGGKTPAQLWAEKHAKKSGGSVSSPSTAELIDKAEGLSLESKPAHYSRDIEEEHEQQQEEEEEPEPEPEPEQPKSSFADLTSRFAQSNSSSPVPAPPVRHSLPQHQPEPEPEYEEPEPARSPSPISIPRAVPSLPSHTPSEVIEPPELSEGTPPIATREEPGRKESIAAALSEGTPIESTPEVESHNKPQPLSSETFIAVVLYDYEKDEANELALKEGEVVTNIEKVDPDWWHGTNSAGESGLFPSNYVEITDEPQPPHATIEPTKSGPSAVAEYDYEAQEDGELSFVEGATITNIDFVDEAWWSGVYEGQTGLFPANYVILKD